jgi:hypothetical protein
MTRDERRKELLDDSTAYCCYCGNEQTSFACCGENHFEAFSDMDEQRQNEFLDAEGV